MGKQATQPTGPKRGLRSLAPLPAGAASQPYTTRLLAAIVAVLPAGMSFLDWYSSPALSTFRGSREAKCAARDAWEDLQDLGDSYGLTVVELLDADNVDYGEYPDDAIDHSMAKEDHRNGAR